MDCGGDHLVKLPWLVLSVVVLKPTGEHPWEFSSPSCDIGLVFSIISGHSCNMKMSSLKSSDAVLNPRMSAYLARGG